MKTAHIPLDLRQRPQWVCWKTVTRGDKPTKIPFQPGGKEAKSTDFVTWSEFDAALASADNFDGIGYVFSEADDFCGIDLDGCRNPETGKVADWAREVILKFGSYAEVSPSQTGVKIWLRGKSPFASGKKVAVDAPKVSDKEPGVEIYDSKRYFAVTGERLAGMRQIKEGQNELYWLKERFWPTQRPAPVESTDVVERARKYLAKVPPSISGQSGHNAAFHAACVLVLGFELSQDESYALLSEWNMRCQPPWSEKELRHKVQSASQQSGERGYLRDVPIGRWASVQVPRYEEATPDISATTLEQATANYLETLRGPTASLIELGLGDLDYALGGGCERGEMVILAGRPSHGKSTVGLQAIHWVTSNGIPALLISEEMSAHALGKRTVQYVSPTPQEHWKTSIDSVERHVREHFSACKPCYLLENCRTAERASDAIEEHADKKGVQVAVVDYAQLLGSSGRSRYEQITNTSIKLRQAANRANVVLLAMCQLSREIEARPKFEPKMSDLKDTGQLEQDADVVVFVVWPHRISAKHDPHEFMFFIGKNRNRGINQAAVKCKFEPSRQMITVPFMKDRVNYQESFDTWNNGEEKRDELS